MEHYRTLSFPGIRWCRRRVRSNRQSGRPCVGRSRAGLDRSEVRPRRHAIKRLGVDAQCHARPERLGPRTPGAVARGCSLENPPGTTPARYGYVSGGYGRRRASTVPPGDIPVPSWGGVWPKWLSGARVVPESSPTRGRSGPPEDARLQRRSCGQTQTQRFPECRSKPRGHPRCPQTPLTQTRARRCNHTTSHSTCRCVLTRGC